MRKSSKISSVILGLIVFITIFSIIIPNNSVIDLGNDENDLYFPSAAQTTVEPSIITCNLIENHSVSILDPYFRFELITDGSFTLYYTIYGTGQDASKVIASAAQEIQIASGTNSFIIPVNLRVDTLPGEYQVSVLIYYYNSSSGTATQQTIRFLENETIHLQMGWVTIIVILGLAMCGLFVIIMKEEKLKEHKVSSSNSTQTYTPGGNSQPSEVSNINENVKSGYIKCPECKKEIIEGSSFCPECGYHIPKFLRTRQ